LPAVPRYTLSHSEDKTGSFFRLLTVLKGPLPKFRRVHQWALYSWYLFSVFVFGKNTLWQMHGKFN